MRRLFLLAAPLLLAAPASAQSLVFRTAPLSDASLAAVVVRGTVRDTLTAGKFSEQLMPIVQQNPELLNDGPQFSLLQRQVVEAFAVQPLIDLEVARTPSVVADTAAVSARIREFVEQMGGQDAFNEQLTAAGLTLDSLRTLLGEQQKQQALFEQWAEGGPEISQEAIAAEQRRQGEEVKVRHIIVASGGESGRSDAEAQALAARVLDSLRAGADFAEMARRHSDDGTAEQGGDLEPFTRMSPLDVAFKRAAFALRRPGELTPEPVQSAFGWHLIRLEERRMGEQPDAAYVLGWLQGRSRMMRVTARVQQLLDGMGVVVHVNRDVVDADLSVPIPGDEVD